jgi:hypothetical protein
MSIGLPADDGVPNPTPIRSIVRKAAAFLFWAIVFGVIYVQAPLYYSNQNQYFLHGLAAGGAGLLREDWLATTADPTPLFSALVAFTYRYLDVDFFYLYYILLFGVYFWSMVGLFDVLSGPASSVSPRPGLSPRGGGEGGEGPRRMAFIVALLVLHSALFRVLCALLLGADYLWYFQAGLAGQYLLSWMWQPSTFGVFLLFSICLFLRDRPFLAGLSLAAAALVHATYLLGAGILTLAYVLILARDKRTRTALLLGAFTLVLVSPMLVYGVVTFGPTSTDAFARAQDLLVHLRVPHHAVVREWFNALAAAQLTWIGWALYLAWGSRLGWILLVSVVVSAILTLVQLITDSNTLALLFPWRTSVYLVPVATAVVLTRVIQWAAPWLETWSARHSLLRRLVPAGIVGMLLVGGVVIQSEGIGYRQNPEEVPMMSYVREHKTSRDVYLLPIEVPRHRLTSLSPLSVQSRPAGGSSTEGGTIASDLQNFRLFTGAPIFIDFKAIPYKDVDVLRWRDRLRQNERFYRQLRAGEFARLGRELKGRGITHVVTRANEAITSPDFQLLYADDYFKVYRVYAEPAFACSPDGWFNVPSPEPPSATPSAPPPSRSPPGSRR